MPIGLLFLLKNDEEEGFFLKNYFVFKIKKKLFPFYLKDRDRQKPSIPWFSLQMPVAGRTGPGQAVARSRGVAGMQGLPGAVSRKLKWGVARVWGLGALHSHGIWACHAGP